MEELIKKAQKGDVEAYTEIILSIKNDLYKIAKTRLTNEDDIDDAIQETMIQVYKSIKKLKTPEKIKTWTISILINNCNRIYKNKHKKDMSMDEYNLEEYLIKNSQYEIENDLNFYFLLEKLRYEERIISYLYYKEDYKIEEIAHILKMNINTVKSNLRRARNKLKKILDKEEMK